MKRLTKTRFAKYQVITIYAGLGEGFVSVNYDTRYKYYANIYKYEMIPT
jgi:hypothetical protein